MNLSNDVISALLAQLPNGNTSQAQQMINAIRNNDAKTGEEIAYNICKAYGKTREEMTQQAITILQNRFPALFPRN